MSSRPSFGRGTSSIQRCEYGHGIGLIRCEIRIPAPMPAAAVRAWVLRSIRSCLSGTRAAGQSAAVLPAVCDARDAVATDPIVSLRPMSDAATLEGHELLASGKVREIYDEGD